MRISGDSDSSVSDLQPVTGILENSKNLGPGMGANKKGVEPRPLQTTPTKGRTEQHKADAPVSRGRGTQCCFGTVKSPEAQVGGICLEAS